MLLYSKWILKNMNDWVFAWKAISMYFRILNRIKQAETGKRERLTQLSRSQNLSFPCLCCIWPQHVVQNSTKFYWTGQKRGEVATSMKATSKWHYTHVSGHSLITVTPASKKSCKRETKQATGQGKSSIIITEGKMDSGGQTGTSGTLTRWHTKLHKYCSSLAEVWAYTS